VVSVFKAEISFTVGGFFATPHDCGASPRI
jgi:hypothetical protein